MTGFRNALLGAAGAAGGGGYSVDNSIVLDDGSSQYLSRTIGTGDNNGKTFTISCWVKRGNLSTQQTLISAGSTTHETEWYFNSSDQLVFTFRTSSTGGFTTNEVFRDPHAWYHLILAVDTTQATATNRARLWLNGSEITSFSSYTNIAQNNTSNMFETAQPLYFGADQTPGNYGDFYMSEVVGISNSQITDATSFGEYDENGVWRPIDVTASLASNLTLSLVAQGAGTAIGDMTDTTAGNSLAAAFDGTFGGNDGANNASKRGTVANAFVGKDWGSGNEKVITGFSTRDVNNAGYFQDTAEGRFYLYGSNSTPSTYNDGTLLYTGATFNSTVAAQSHDYFDTANFDTSTAFRYHWVALVPTTSVGNVRMAELYFYEDGGNFGTNGFYLPFTDSGQLGADSSTGNQTSITLSGEWTGDTGDFTTLNTNIVPALGQTGAIKSVDTFTGDFAIEFEWQGGANPAYLGVYEIDEDGTFSQTSADGGLGSMTDSFYLFFTSGNAVNAVNGSSTEASSIFTAAAGEVVKFQRSGSTFTVYEDGVLRHTFTATSANEVRIVVGQNSSSMDWRDFRWVSGGTTIGNPFTPSGSPTQSSDTPTNNYSVMSPLSAYSNGLVDLSNGNLSVANSDANYDSVGSSILIPDSGKWGWQFTLTSSVTGLEIGFHDPAAGETGGLAQGGSVCLDGVRVDLAGGEIFRKVGSSTWSSVQTGLGAGANTDVFEFLWDATNGTLDIKKNGSAYGSQVTGLNSKPMRVVLDTQQTSMDFDFGQNGYTPSDSNYLTINTANLYTNAAPAIEDGTAHFQATLYEGNGGTAQNIDQSENTKFQPNFVWIKNRDAAYQHKLLDAIRGVGNVVYSDGPDAEASESTGLTSFDTDGFGLGTDNGGYNSANSFVAWQWKAGGEPTTDNIAGAGNVPTAGSVKINGVNSTSNLAGSIPATRISANTTAGFSIVKYTSTNGSGAGTVGHGQTGALDLILVKNLDSTDNWAVYHSGNTSAPETDYLILNLVNTTADSNTFWNDTAPTSTVFSVGTSGAVNDQGAATNHIAYCFRSIPGYSAFGSYTGNTSTDGPVIMLDFTPAWVVVKRTSSTGDWISKTRIIDPANPLNNRLYLNEPNTESSSDYLIDILSNGFKVRDAQVGINGGTLIYFAFAEHPFAGSSPATAK